MTTEDNMEDEMFSEAAASEPVEQEQPVTPEPEGEATPQEDATQAVQAEAEPVGDAVTKGDPVEQPEISAAPDTEEAQQEGGEQPKGWVPPHLLRETKERARKAEAELEETTKTTQQLQRELAELRSHVLKGTQPQPEQKPEDNPDFFADPDAAFRQYRDTLTQEIRAELAKDRAQTSFAIAGMKYGDEFRQAYDAVNNGNDQQLAQAIWNAPDPGEALVQHHRRDKLLRETGGDLVSYEAKLQERLLSDPEFLSKAAEAARAQAQTTTATGAPHLNIPASVNSGTRSGDARPTAAANQSADEMFLDAVR